MGSSLIQMFMEGGLVEDAADIFMIQKGDLLQLDLFQEKRADNIILAIKDAKLVEFPQFIFALGIRYVGTETAEILSKKVSLHCETITIKKKIVHDQMNLFTGEEYEEKSFTVASIEDFLLSITAYNLEMLEAIDGIGTKVAESIYTWFANQKNQELLSKLHANGVRIYLIQRMLWIII